MQGELTINHVLVPFAIYDESEEVVKAILWEAYKAARTFAEQERQFWEKPEPAK